MGPASLLTGCNPGNVGLSNILLAHRDTPGLAPGAPTLAEAPNAEGYSTGPAEQ